MRSDFDTSIKNRFLYYLEKEISFIARYPENAESGHREAVKLVETLMRFELISLIEHEALLNDIEQALLAALRRRSGCPKLQ